MHVALATSRLALHATKRGVGVAARTLREAQTQSQATATSGLLALRATLDAATDVDGRGGGLIAVAGCALVAGLVVRVEELRRPEGKVVDIDEASL